MCEREGLKERLPSLSRHLPPSFHPLLLVQQPVHVLNLAPVPLLQRHRGELQEDRRKGAGRTMMRERERQGGQRQGGMRRQGDKKKMGEAGRTEAGRNEEAG